MAGSSGFVVKVDTGRLNTVAKDVETKIRRLEQTMNGIERKISACRSYWEGEGASAYMGVYRKKASTVQEALRRFRENVTDLQKIAGIYEESERSVTSENAQLRTDWLD